MPNVVKFPTSSNKMSANDIISANANVIGEEGFSDWRVDFRAKDIASTNMAEAA